MEKFLTNSVYHEPTSPGGKHMYITIEDKS